MKKAFLVTIAALTLAACGSNSAKTQKSASGVSDESSRLHRESTRLSEDGVPATAESIIGTWCSIDSSVGKKVRFGEKNVFTLIKKDGSVQSAPYFFKSDGTLNVGGEAVQATIAEETAQSTKVLSLQTSADNTEIMEPCTAADQESKEESKEEEKEEPKKEKLPEAPKST